MATINILLTTIIIISLVLNAIVIAALLKSWKKLISHDVLLLALSICDLLQVLIGYPLELGFDLSQHRIQCVIAGYSTSTLALISMSLLLLMSIARMIGISYPLRSYQRMQRKRTSLYFIIPGVLYGLLWGSFPLIGWSKYTTEMKSKHRCTINLNDQEIGTITYLHFLLIFCYIIPISLMIYNFIKITKELRRMSRSARLSMGTMSRFTQDTINNERRYIALLTVMFISFVLSWTPYAIIVLLLSFGKMITSTWLDVAAMLGKSSTFYNPIIYVFMYKQYRTAVVQLFSFRTRKIKTCAVFMLESSIQ